MDKDDVEYKPKNNILVTSAGFNSVNNYVSEENFKKFEEISKGKKVIIIANAAPEGSGNYIARENVKENFLKVGASTCDIVDLTDENSDEILDYDVIYVIGGNITNLVLLNYNPKVKKNILKFMEHGIYIGESAGSIFFSGDTKYYYDIKRGTKEKYNVDLESYAGLGLIDLNIFPHYNKANEEIKEKINNYERESGQSITRMLNGDIIYCSI